MRTFSILVASLLACLVHAAKDPKCTQGLQGLIAPLTAYPPATNFCKTKFPAGTKTSTILTTSTNVIGVTATVTAATSTVTQLTTVTSTTTLYQNAARRAGRNAAPAHASATPVDQHAAQWASVTKVAGAILSTFCSCAIPPISTTTTATIHASTTSTSTETITPLATTTVTATAIATAYAPPFKPCSNPYTPGYNSDQCGGGSCYCDNYVNGGGVCSDALMCTNPCDQDTDCPGGSVCITGAQCSTNGRTCVAYVSCAGPRARRVRKDVVASKVDALFAPGSFKRPPVE